MPEYAVKPAPGKLRRYRFGVHLGHHPQKLDQVFSPLMSYLSQHVPGAEFDLEGASGFDHFESKLRARQLDFALPNPYQATLALDWGYRIIAEVGDSTDFKGIFIVRKDSAIRAPGDLKGGIVAYPAPSALAAGMMPKLWLANHGIDVNRDIDNHYVGSQESAILNAYLKEADVGATWPPPWRAFRDAHPKEAAQLRVIWETPPLISNAVVVRADLPDVLVEQVRHALLGMNRDPEGQAVLAAMDAAHIHPASDASYQVVRRFIADYEAKVGPRP